jgi:hypothetical protein
LNKILKRKAGQMISAFARVVIGAIVIVTANAGSTTNASAVTLSYEYSGTGNVNFQSDTTLGIGGTCSSPCVISALMTIDGTGPAFSSSTPSGSSGWGALASTAITDNLGDTISLEVNNGDVPGTNHEEFGGVFFASALPSTLDISTSSLASIFGGSGTIDYTINISLPNGAYVTPLPSALPLFATGLGALGLLGWHRRRKALASQDPRLRAHSTHWLPCLGN